MSTEETEPEVETIGVEVPPEVEFAATAAAAAAAATEGCTKGRG